MKKYSISILALAFVLASVATAGAATGKKPVLVPFTGTYAGQASTQVTGTAATISANGTGKGTLIGAGSITGQGTGDTSQQPCIPFGGTGTIKGAAGTIAFKLAPGGKQLRGRRRPQLRHRRPSHRSVGDRKARQGEGDPEAHGHLQP